MRRAAGMAGVVMMALFSFSPAARAGVKKPNVAGCFYPGDAAALREMIQTYLKEASLPEGSPQDPAVLIVPHAGYVYSGPVAAYGFKSVQGRRYDTVVVLAGSHFFSFRGAAVYYEGAFRTPLGDIPVDTATVDALIAETSGWVKVAPAVFEREHALEVELPFLQSVLKDLKIVPVIFGEAALGDLELMGKALGRILKDKRALVVVSTDLSHYKRYDAACSLDRETIDLILDGDTQGIWDSVAAGGGNMCGTKPVLAGMYYAQARGANKATLLKCANSGDTAGDKSRVVGYASIVFSPGGAAKDRPEVPARSHNPKEDVMLTKEEKKLLIAVARQAIEARVAGRDVSVKREDSAGLNLRLGAFVTLHKHGRLRGCIGLFTSNEPLYLVVAQMAAAAATQDHRFPPVRPDELKEIDIEISVLSEPKPIDDWKSVRLGVDGVIVRRGIASGVFLPQVATETGWDLDTFLGQLCSQKAGLARECYKDPGTRLLTFQADVFSLDHLD